MTVGELLEGGVGVGTGAGFVDLFGTLGGVDENDDFVGLHFYDAFGNGGTKALGHAVTDCGKIQLAGDDGGNVVAVMCEDAVLPRCGGNDEGKTLPLKKRSIRSQNAQREGVGHAMPPPIDFAFSRASSIVPTL